MACVFRLDQAVLIDREALPLLRVALFFVLPLHVLGDAEVGLEAAALGLEQAVHDRHGAQLGAHHVRPEAGYGQCAAPVRYEAAGAALDQCPYL